MRVRSTFLRELRGRYGRDVPFDVLLGRSADQKIGSVVVHVAGLEDIIATKEFAGSDKDHDALRELRDTS